MSLPKLFCVHLKKLSIPKNLRTLKTNFEEADGLGKRFQVRRQFQHFRQFDMNRTLISIFQWLLWMEPSENTKRGWLARFALCNQSRLHYGRKF